MTRESNEFLPKKEEKPTEEVNEAAKKGNKFGLLPNFYYPSSPQQLVEDMRNLKRWKEQPLEMDTELRSCPHQPDIFDVFGTNADMINLVATNGEFILLFSIISAKLVLLVPNCN